MRKVVGAVLLAVAGLWILLQNGQLGPLEKYLPNLGGGGLTEAAADVPTLDAVRVASFNIQVFGDAKVGKPEVMRVLLDVIRQFDVVAVQEIRSKNENLLPAFVAQLNSTGRQYDHLIGPRLGRSSSKEQYAFIFDTATIETDRSALQTVDDRYDLLHREPLVGAFRVRGPSPETAYTFTLINIHTDPDEVRRELDALDEVYRAVRDDGRGEDDIILLGDLNADDRMFGQLASIPGMSWAISGVPTNTRGSELYDNILFNRAATTEFTGRAGVMDMMSQYGLTMDQALEVSDHLPIWAEFSAYEGGQSNRLAAVPEPVRAR